MLDIEIKSSRLTISTQKVRSLFVDKNKFTEFSRKLFLKIQQTSRLMHPVNILVIIMRSVGHKTRGKHGTKSSK